MHLGNAMPWPTKICVREKLDLVFRLITYESRLNKPLRNRVLYILYCPHGSPCAFFVHLGLGLASSKPIPCANTLAPIGAAVKGESGLL
jgi:hypothetical protein